jgi:hypothetical protein
VTVTAAGSGARRQCRVRWFFRRGNAADLRTPAGTVGLERCRDVSPSEWLRSDPGDPVRLIALGPAGYDALARVRFIDDPARPGQSENDAHRRPDSMTDLEQVARALRVLARFTTTPEHAYFCHWTGYESASGRAQVAGPLLILPDRSYALFEGGLEDFSGWSAAIGTTSDLPPAFVWPADRSWCLARDVDAHFAAVCASEAAVSALLGDADLDVALLSPGETPPRYQ